MLWYIELEIVPGKNIYDSPHITQSIPGSIVAAPDRDRYSALVIGDSVQALLIDARVCAAGLDQTGARHRQQPIAPFTLIVVKRRMRLQIQPVVVPTKQVWLINDAHRRTNPDLGEQVLDVFGIQPDTAVADAHADAGRFVRAVNQVTGKTKTQRVTSQRVIRPGRHLPGQRVAGSQALGSHRFWYEPDRITRP